jgi:hypothetical protein
MGGPKRRLRPAEWLVFPVAAQSPVTFVGKPGAAESSGTPGIRTRSGAAEKSGNPELGTEETKTRDHKKGWLPPLSELVPKPKGPTPIWFYRG